MKKFAFLVLVMLAFVNTATSQILEPVKWTSEVKKTGENTYDLIFNATIEDKWHLYTQDLPEDGPIPTTFNFENAGDKYELVGKVSESESHTSFDKIFEMELSYFDNSAQFIQKIKVLDSSLGTINAGVDFQSCDDEKCIFEMAEFELNIPGGTTSSADAVAGDNQESQIFEPVTWKSEIRKIGADTYELIFNASIEDKWHVYSVNPFEGTDPSVIAPNPTAFNLGENPGVEAVGSLVELGKPIKKFDKVFELDVEYFDNNADFLQKIKVTDASLKNITVAIDYQTCDDEKCIFPSQEFSFKIPAADAKIEKATTDVTGEAGDEDEDGDSRGMLTIFILSFLSGFAALLTPCVFPMIPMTVSFFTKQSKNRAAGIKNAIMYGIFIIVIYVLLGSLVTGIFGADALNALSTNVWFNVIFFLLLIIFAMSFLGAFEIMLPNSWANKIDSKADRGGVIGIFFMALALAIVSFSCTGPIVGTLLERRHQKEGWHILLVCLVSL